MAGKHHFASNRPAHIYNTLLVAAIAVICWSGTSSTLTLLNPPVQVVAQVAPTHEQEAPETPHALPTTDVEVVNAKALGFLTALIKDGVDVSSHEYHMVMIAEAMCSPSGDGWESGKTTEREDAVQLFFPHLSDKQTAAFVNATQFYCHALKGTK